MDENDGPKLKVRGAKHHNLKNVDVDIPKNSLVVISGISGSGKSTLAFDTIYAEGQRRYVESLSAYARQFLEMMDKPDVDSIEGLSPAISIQQKTTNKNPRSTVGTITEIYDYLRLLYARIGIPHCTNCEREISTQSVETICDTILREFQNQKILVLSPIIQHKKGTYEKLFEQIKKDGYSRIRVDNEIVNLDNDENVENEYNDNNEDNIKKKNHDKKADKSKKNIDIPTLDKQKWHDIEIVVDRISASKVEKSRLFEAIQTALKVSKGYVMISNLDKNNKNKDQIFSQRNACPYCGVSIGDLEPRIFSFNSPFGMCNECNGLGVMEEIDPDLMIRDKTLSIIEGGMIPLAFHEFDMEIIEFAAEEYGFNPETPIKNINPKAINMILYGIPKNFTSRVSKNNRRQKKMVGVVEYFNSLLQSAPNETEKLILRQYTKDSLCNVCNGQKLKQEALAVKINDKSITQVCDLSIDNCYDFFKTLKLTETEKHIAKDVLKEITERLEFLKNVGLNYLTLNRTSTTLSGGESQRIRLATQIGSNLTGVLYVLDEPTIGLHQRDNSRLIKTLTKLRNLGNTVIIVEHDEEVIRNADWLIDLGPGAGIHGGNIVFEGTIEDILKDKNSVTGKYLQNKSLITLKDRKQNRDKRKNNGFIKVVGAAKNNLKNIDVEFPLRSLTTVTGVSGSGKSTLVNEILLKTSESHFNRIHTRSSRKHRQIEGLENINKVIAIDQSPIGRTPRSNPATYIGVFTLIRNIFAKTQRAKELGYTIGQFSFNVQAGRCFACNGDGVKRIEMQFLSDVYVKCDECEGKRYNTETLSVLYKGKNISDVLNMTIEEALAFFTNVPRIKSKLQTIYDVGLGYVKLGQSSTTLSGGEAQRVKLAAELSKTSTGNTMYILDEPTTGLHFVDVQKLLEVLNRLVSLGNTAIVIEHNMDVIKNSDWIIDLGPEGGDEGGKVVAVGTPEQISVAPGSHTGKYLKKTLREEESIVT